MSALAPDEVRVWYRLTETIRDDTLGELAETLSGEERERYRRFVFAHDRRDFAAAHVLLRQTLSLYGDLSPTEWRFEANAHGKPAVIAAQSATLAFNLSHTRGLVACAVAHRAALGIDVESVERATGDRDIAARYFSPAETRALDAAPPLAYAGKFIELWTLKEAYIKGLGLGLTHALDTHAFTFEGDEGIRFDAPPDSHHRHWRFLIAAPAPDYRLAVAVGHAGGPARDRITIQDADRAYAPPLTPVRQSTP